MSSLQPAAPLLVPDLSDSHGRAVSPDLSAERTTTPAQRLFFCCLAILMIGGILRFGFVTVANGVNEGILALYGFILLHRCAALVAGFMYERQKVQAPAEPAPEDLPLVSVLVPLYRESGVIPQIVGAVGRLDYPPERLEVILLLEEDDWDTRLACESLDLPSNVHPCIVPAGVPRTKPRACNHGLVQCRGEISVVYDAEDQPEPDQLLKAVALLAATPPQVACVQARLAYYNPRQNALTRWFAAEYMSWFELMLPGLHAIHAPIPLGGTSNVFRTAALRQLGGWDAWNVAEDCDLGMRLYRAGYRVLLLDSTTWEEACPEPRLWIRQRSRWIKGYLQTWLVHSRRPLQLWRELGPWGFLNLQTLIGGTVLCLLLNPVYWLLTALWWTHPTGLESSLMGGPVLMLGNLSWIGGNTIFIALHCAGPLRRRQWSLVTLGLLVPFYWIMMSIAAWKGVLQLLTAPHHWEKTTHGLSHMPPADALPEGSSAGAAPASVSNTK